MNLDMLQAYLRRVGLPESYLEQQGFYHITNKEISAHLEVSVQKKIKTLIDLHRAHATHISFDNKDSFDHKTFSLKKQDVFHKLVTKTQGGSCLETNELLRKILNFLRIKTDRLQARVDITGQTEFTHKLLLTTIDDKQWLADVGFGGKYPSLIEPIPLTENIVFEQGPYQFKLEHQSGLYHLLAKEKNERYFLKLYSFDLKPHPASDFRDEDGTPKLPANFSQKHIVSQWNPDETRVWSVTTRSDLPRLAS